MRLKIVLRIVSALVLVVGVFFAPVASASLDELAFAPIAEKNPQPNTGPGLDPNG